jgi:hypothetical protein
MSSMDFRVLFERRPASATVALALAGASAVATLFQGASALLGLAGFYFDFAYREIAGEGVRNWGMGVFAILWAALLLTACFRALAPRPGARFAVLALAGLKLIAFLGAKAEMPWPQYLALMLFAAAPVFLLLNRPNNRYYASRYA